MKNSLKITLIFLVLFLSKSILQAQPMMGWSSWNANGLNISEDLIKETSDYMVLHGLNEVGYTWVNTDDGFFDGRDSNGNLKISPRFPNGIKEIADYIRAKGLDPGIYSEVGLSTCGHHYQGDGGGGNAGLYGREEQDLRLYFDTYGFDFIKVDYCGAEIQGLDEQTSYTNISNIINDLEAELGRPLKYNICRWIFPGTWVRDVADSWRISGDITDNFGSIKSIIELNLYLAPYASWNKYNDMDMLQLGRGLNIEEEKTHFGIWSIMSSPLMIGCNLKGIRQSTLDILKNTEVIAINQDQLGLQAELIHRSGNCMVLAKPIEELHGKVRAVALYNAGESEKTIRVNFKDIQLSEKASVRDLWSHTDLGKFTGYYETRVPAHGTAMLRVEGEYAIDKLRYQGEYAYMNKYSALNLAENARYQKKADILTSGGYVMGWLGNGNDNWAEYKDVYVSKGGKYTFKLYYLSGLDRGLTVIVNGEEYQMENLNSGGFDKRGTAEIEIELNQGNNVIRLANTTDWAPDIDKFELIPEGESIDADNFDIIDMGGQFPVISSEDSSNETWYYIQFKSSEGVLQDMGEDQFMLTKEMTEQTPAQHWKVVEVSNPSGDYKYRIVNKNGKALSHVAVTETSDGFYKTTNSVSDMAKFRIIATDNSHHSPAWELERQGTNRRINQYDPTQTSGYNKNISEWDANDNGNSLIFVPVQEGMGITLVKNNSSRAKIAYLNNGVQLDGDDIVNVRLYSINGQLTETKAKSPFIFTLPTQACYLAAIKYKDNQVEVLKVFIR